MKPPPIDIALRSPHAALAVVAVAYAATGVLVGVLELPQAARIGGLLAIVAAYGLALRKLVGAHAPGRIRVGLDRRITVTSRNGFRRDGIVTADSFVAARLVTVVWRPDGARRARTLMFLPDALSAAESRRLRVVLRYGRAAEVSTATR